MPTGEGTGRADGQQPGASRQEVAERSLVPAENNPRSTQLAADNTTAGFPENATGGEGWPPPKSPSQPNRLRGILGRPQRQSWRRCQWRAHVKEKIPEYLAERFPARMSFAVRCWRRRHQ